MEEIWKDIDGYEGLYKVSNYGNVKTFYKCSEGIEMTLIVTRDDYLCLSLSKHGHLTRCAVHRLVALAFIPNIDNKPQVNHIDGNKQNNRVDNLEWVTNNENRTHAIKEGLVNDRGIDNPNAKLTESQVRDIYRLSHEGIMKVHEIASMFNIGRQAVRLIRQRKRWTHLEM